MPARLMVLSTCTNWKEKKNLLLQGPPRHGLVQNLTVLHLTPKRAQRKVTGIPETETEKALGRKHRLQAAGRIWDQR